MQAARKAPQRRLLDEIAEMSLGITGMNSNQTLLAAEQMLRGTLSLEGYAPAPITLPFAPKELEQGLPGRQLMIAGLAIPSVLLDAYRITRREEFFQHARDAIVAFARYESTRWVNHGFLWNDHAISARIAVLVKFWMEYREHPDFEPEVGRIIISLVSRSARLLAKPAFYAPGTDHGIMANLAILQVTAAFPELLDSGELRGVATERFRNHLRYYIADEGVTLLHSAGYHSLGLRNFGMALRLFTLNGIDIPVDWWTKYSKAVGFYAQLRRPDRTLPMFGDTTSMAEQLRPLLTRRNVDTGQAEPLMESEIPPNHDFFSIYPVAGHAVWWDRSPQQPGEAGNQTVITWSFHKGLGHKNADELSVLIWARGQTWLTNTGYWPYGVWGRDRAESWEASNAPHLLGESKDSKRISRVKRVGQGQQIAFIDIERYTTHGYAVRRQIIRLLDLDTWVVLDHFADAVARTTTTNWTFHPDLVVTAGPDEGLFRVTPNDSRMTLMCWLSSSSSSVKELVVGRDTPFAGWVVINGIPRRSPSVIVRQSSQDTWSLATFAFSDIDPKSSFRHRPRMNDWIDSDHWALTIPTATGEISLTRKGDRLLIRQPGTSGNNTAVELTELDAPASEIHAVRDAFRLVSEHHKKFRELLPYRVKVSYLMLIVLVSQELFLFLLGLKMSRTAHAMRVAIWIIWLAGGIWLSGSYLQVA